MKTCTRCNQLKLENMFGEAKDARRKTPGLKSWCKSCEAEYQRKIYANNSSKQLERRKIYLERYRDKYNQSRRDNRFEIYVTECSRKYHTTESKIKELLAIGCCQICTSQKRLVIDHCHKTNQLRGLLCDQCNNLLGRAKDNTETLKNAIKYLTKCSNI